MNGYTVKAWDVVAYQYQADEFCPADIVDAVTATPKYAAWLTLDRTPEASAEKELDAIAFAYGISRYDESSFDSGDFPKVIFSSQLEDDIYCATCGERFPG